MFSQPLLADVDGSQIKNFGESFLWLMAIAAAVFGAIKYLRPKEPTEIQSPLVVKPHQEYTPIELAIRLEKDINALREQRRIDVAGLQRKIEDGLIGLRSDLARDSKEDRAADALRGAEIASLKAETGHQTRQLAVLDAKLEYLPEKLLKMLGRARS